MRDFLACVLLLVVTGAFLGWIVPVIPVLLIGTALGFKVDPDAFAPWWLVCVGVWTVGGLAVLEVSTWRDNRRTHAGPTKDAS